MEYFSSASLFPQASKHSAVGWVRGDPLWFSLPARDNNIIAEEARWEEKEFGKESPRAERPKTVQRPPLFRPLTWSTGRPIGGAIQVSAANGKSARRAPPGAISARGRRKVKVGRWPQAQQLVRVLGCSRTSRMLRAPEPRPGQAGAVTQARPLTSFLIQDILRDSIEQRDRHTGSPQPGPPHQWAAGRHPESEPQGRREDAGAQEDDPIPQPGAAPREAESPAETEPGKPARPGRPGWPGWSPAKVVPPAGCAGVRAGPRCTSRSSCCRYEGPRSDRRRDRTASRCGRATDINPEPQRPGGAGCRLSPGAPLSVGSQHLGLKSQSARSATVPPESVESRPWHPATPRLSIAASPRLQLRSYNDWCIATNL